MKVWVTGVESRVYSNYFVNIATKFYNTFEIFPFSQRKSVFTRRKSIIHLKHYAFQSIKGCFTPSTEFLGE